MLVSRSRVGVLFGSLVLVGSVSFVAAGSAEAKPRKGNPPLCGATVTSDVILTADLVCNGTGITVAASGVTVDLNGHEIRDAFSGSGTAISANGVSDITVKDGTLAEFEVGVNLVNVTHASLDRINVHLSSPQLFSQGLALSSVHDSVISNDEIYDPFIGISDQSGSGNSVSDNTIDHMGLNNPSYSLIGIFTFGSTGDTISGNRVSGGNGVSSAEAIRVEQATATTVMKNFVDGLGSGVVDATSVGTIVDDNDSFDTTEGLLAVSPSQAIYEHNRFKNGDNGIEIISPQGVVISDNMTNGNSSYGIHILGTASAVPTGNTANANKYGIVSQLPINVSGPVNHASGNHTANCVNVTPCT